MIQLPEGITRQDLEAMIDLLNSWGEKRQTEGMIDAISHFLNVSGWKQRAEAAEEKLAELEKQEPELWEIENPGEGTYYSPHNPDENDYRHALIVREWFTRPVPAINLAELVPDYLLDALCRLDLPGVSIGDKAIIGKAIEVLRNIEEQSR